MLFILGLLFVWCSPGNCVRPVLFLIYNNDISRNIMSGTKLFADDMQVYTVLRGALRKMWKNYRNILLVWNIGAKCEMMRNSKKRHIIYVVTTWKVYLRLRILEFVLLRTCPEACKQKNVQIRQTVCLDLWDVQLLPEILSCFPNFIELSNSNTRVLLSSVVPAP